MGQVTVLGSINMDILATLNRMPRAGETVNGDGVIFGPGGKGLNQAVAARRMGAGVRFVGRIGADSSGADLVKFLKNEAIATDQIVLDAAVATGCALVMVDHSAENHIIVIPGANQRIPVDCGADLTFAAGDWVVSQFEVPRAAIAATFARAKALGAMTLLNAAPALDDAPAELWLTTDLLVVNETELAHFSGADIAADAALSAIAAAARKLIRRSDQAIVATLGARGAILVTQETVLEVPGRTVTPVDTTGAGDCFVGALAAGLASGLDRASALHRAGVAASIQVTRLGAGAAMPTLAEVIAVG